MTSLLFLFFFPLLPNFQSFRQAEWIPAGKLHFESDLHPRWNDCPTEPCTAASRSSRLRPEGLLPAGLPRLRVQAETLWPASALAGPHPICGSHYREGRCHHSEYHQADSVQVSAPSCFRLRVPSTLHSRRLLWYLMASWTGLWFLLIHYLGIRKTLWFDISVCVLHKT